MHRRFEFVGGSSAKFWEVRAQGRETIVRFGRIGTPGQSQTNVFGSAEEATRHAEKLITQKLGKGYVEVALVNGIVLRRRNLFTLKELSHVQDRD